MIESKQKRFIAVLVLLGLPLATSLIARIGGRADESLLIGSICLIPVVSLVAAAIMAWKMTGSPGRRILLGVVFFIAFNLTSGFLAFIGCVGLASYLTH
jgi:hypothetical protein